MTETTTIPEPASDERPRIRAAAIAWGLVVIALGGALVGIAVDPQRRDEVIDWATHLTAGGVALAVALVLGGVLLLVGVLSGIRGLQRRR